MHSILLQSGRQDWETPAKLFEELDKEFHFTLDPCSSHSNAKCKNHFTIEENGLEKPWGGNVVFCNPPFSKGMKPWIKKCYEESLKPDTTVVLLVPARTDTTWFHDYILGKAEIRFIKGRTKFETNGVPGRAAPFPTMICIYR